MRINQNQQTQMRQRTQETTKTKEKVSSEMNTRILKRQRR